MDSSTPTVKWYDRRLSDKLMLAFDQACDAGLEKSAQILLGLLEEQIFRENTFPGRERRSTTDYVAYAQKRIASIGAQTANVRESGWATVGGNWAMERRTTHAAS